MRKSILGHFAMLLCVALFTTSCAHEDPRQKTWEPMSGDPVDSLQLEVQIDTFVDTTYYTGIDSAALVLDTMFYNKENDSTTLIFAVDNYVLGMPTAHEGSMHLANSANGQHIHLIVEGNPYEAHYSNEIHVKGDLTSKVFLAFLSRSYHLSLKHEAARYLHIPSSRLSDINPTDPMIFASRPKGTYEGIDAESVLLDFYLVNANMPESGFEVVVKIDGKEITRLPEWRPYVITGLTAGEYKLGLELQGKNGEGTEGRYASTTQKFAIQ